MSTSTLNGSPEGLLSGRTALVAGGTGNVGRHIVRALLRHGAVVVVPSRSEPKLEALRAALGEAAARLVTIGGNVGDEGDAARIRDEVARRTGAPLDAVVASLGHYVSAPSLLAAKRAELLEVVEDYVAAHFVAARTFLPDVVSNGGSYTFINGPSAYGSWPGSGLVSIATAAQAMLAQVATAEAGAAAGARITQLVIHPTEWIGPDAALDVDVDDALGANVVNGATIGEYLALLVAGRVAAEPTVHLTARSLRDTAQCRSSASPPRRSPAPSPSGARAP